MKRLDKIIICVLFALLFFLLFFAATRNIAAALFITLLACVLLYRLFIHAIVRKRLKKKITPNEMEDYFALRASAFQTDFFMRATASYFNPERCENGYTITLNTVKTFIFPCYKFSPCSQDDIARAYRTAVELKINDVWVLSKFNPRPLLLFANSLGLNFNFVSSKKVLDFLYKRNMLPEIKPKESRKKLELKAILSDVFSKKRAKYFLYASLALGISSILSPFKIFYLVFCAISFALCLTCFFRGVKE